METVMVTPNLGPEPSALHALNSKTPNPKCRDDKELNFAMKSADSSFGNDLSANCRRFSDWASSFGSKVEPQSAKRTPYIIQGSMEAGL